MSLKKLLLAGTAALLLSVLALPAASSGAAAKPTIIIGSTNFEEQAIVSNLYGDVLQKAGYTVKVEPALGTRQVVVPALEKGQLDLEPDYAGTLLDYLNGGAVVAAGNNIATAVPALKAKLATYGVTVLTPAPAVDTNVFAVTKATATHYHLTTLSSLKPVASKLTLGGPPECPQNAGCEKGLKSVYGLNFTSFKSLDEAGPLSVAALKNGEVQVVELFSSDGTVVSNHFVALTDNKHLEPADHIIPVIRTSANSAGVARALDALSAKLTTDQISKLNLLVTGPQKESPASVAQTWLKQQGLA
ncbi:MAG TPA: ABC transporter substrate-binding protein [Acidimicrobiales bacterium]|jgi:osmoprotectant transport system substrate-binding protein|nr:ABC transporter substrate-binding protein [Acidimicrobiales bacterium]